MLFNYVDMFAKIRQNRIETDNSQYYMNLYSLFMLIYFTCDFNLSHGPVLAKQYFSLSKIKCTVH